MDWAPGFRKGDRAPSFSVAGLRRCGRLLPAYGGARASRGCKATLELRTQHVIHNFHRCDRTQLGEARDPVSGDAARHDAVVVR